MDIALGIWSAGLFFLAGLTIGKIRWGHSEWGDVVTEGEGGEQKAARAERKGITSERKGIPGEKRIPLGWAVGSPVAGAVSYFNEGTKRGAKILPEQGIVYAPAAGKITRLYPTGNAMRLRTDYGIELLIQAGVDTEELEGRHYRARVLKNEVVNKGKPLVEFDVEAIRREGYDPSVVMTVEDAENFQDITVCDTPNVKAGENLLWVRK